MTEAPRSQPMDIASTLNETRDGWNAAMNLRFVRATADEVIGEIEIAPCHRQLYGIVHGGVHAGVIETVASVGAGINAAARGQSVVGLENHTSFIRATREGILRATARPITRGRRTQVWEATVVDGTGHIVATGRVRLMCLDADVPLAGQTVQGKLQGG
jgi:1,4-dihydroxy-2-naphthoyl-CoA hydrolase